MAVEFVYAWGVHYVEGFCWAEEREMRMGDGLGVG